MPTSPAPIGRAPFGVTAFAPLLWGLPGGQPRESVHTTALLGTDVRFGREESEKFTGSPPAFSVEDATEPTSAGGSPDLRTTYSYLARPTPQPINAPAPAPYHDPTIAAPPAPIR
jgi:hypothetical protein